MLDPKAIESWVEKQEQAIEEAAEAAAENGKSYTAPEMLDQAYIARGLSRILDVEEETILEQLGRTNRQNEVIKEEGGPGRGRRGPPVHQRRNR